MVHENFGIFTRTLLKQGFYNPDQPQNLMKEKEEGKEDSKGEITGNTYNL